MSDFEKCIKRKSLVRLAAAGPDVISNELRVAREDLSAATLMLDHEHWRRATATAYYAMFHAARALVLHQGYAEKSHYCLIVAFREFHGGTDEGRRLANALEAARTLRENADYEGTASEEAARSTADVAARFVTFAETQLAG